MSELQIEKGVEILSTLRRELSWSHYEALLRVEKPEVIVARKVELIVVNHICGYFIFSV